MHPLTTTVKNWVFKSYFFVKIFLIYDYPQLREMRGGGQEQWSLCDFAKKPTSSLSKVNFAFLSPNLET